MYFSQKISLVTEKQFEILDITKHVEEAVVASKFRSGFVTVFSPHTTAAVRLNHLEPLLLQDFFKAVHRIAPMENNYAHDFFEARTRKNSGERTSGHAHIKTFMLGSSEIIPFENKKLCLGRYQSILFIEFNGGRKRECIAAILGD